MLFLTEVLKQQYKSKLLNIIRMKSIKNGDFILSSGQSSNYFFNMKTTMLDPEAANLLAPLLCDEIGEADAIGGLVMGAVPIVSLVAAESFYGDHPMVGFFVRKESKGHGTDQIIEGGLLPTMKVVMLEDVTTTGDSVLKAIKAVRNFGCEVNRVITIVDRLEGAKQNLELHGLSLTSLFTTEDFK